VLFLGGMVYGEIVVGVAAAAVAFQIVVMVMAGRRRAAPLPMKVHAAAGAAIALTAAAIGVSTHAARAIAFDALIVRGHPLGNYLGMLTGLVGQMTAIAFGIATIVLALTFWFAGLAFTLSKPLADGQARGFPPAALVGVGLLPVVYGALRWSRDVVVPFNTLEDIPEGQRGDVIERTMDVARAHFEHAARLSMVAIPVLAIVAAILIVLRARNAAARRAPSHRTTAALVAGFLALAALMFVEARPISSENDLPWPPRAVGHRLPALDPPTPDLSGPDQVEWAPVVQASPDRLGLDGAEIPDFATLYDRLDLLRVNYKTIHGGPDFNDMAVILADPRTPMARLHSVLQAALKAEYHKPLFTFTKAEVIQRPILGRLQRMNASGVRVKLAYADGKNAYGDAAEEDDDDEKEAALWKDAVPLRPGDFATYDPFARRLVDLRAAGTRVVVRIDRPRR